MQKRIMMFFAILVTTAQVWGATPQTVNDVKQQYIQKFPWIMLLALDPTDPTKVVPVEIDANGNLSVVFPSGGAGAVDQGDQAATSGSPWYFTPTRRSDGAEFGLPATPFGVNLYDAASNVIGVPASPVVTESDISDGNPIAGKNIYPLAAHDSGTFLYLNSRNRLLSLVGAQSPSDGWSNSTFGLLQGSSTQYPQFMGTMYYNNTTWDKVRGTLLDGALVNLGTNNDVKIIHAPVISGGGSPVTITTSATQILPLDLARTSALIQNTGTESIFIGPAGVTTATGVILYGGVADNDGKGRDITIRSTAAIFGIVIADTETARALAETE